MNQKIQSRLEQLERDKSITILYACESGSRAGGYNSLNSDYDVRFIYKLRMMCYQELILQESMRPSTISFMEENRTLDFHGWELGFALKKVYEGNPAVMEWLHNQPVYKQRSWEFTNKLRTACAPHLHPNRLANGYRARALSYLDFGWENKTLFSAKAIANALYFGLRSRYALFSRKFLPSTISALVYDAHHGGYIDGELKAQILDFVEKRKKAREDDQIEMAPIFREFFISVQNHPKLVTPPHFHIQPSGLNNLWRSEITI